MKEEIKLTEGEVGIEQKKITQKIEVSLKSEKDMKRLEDFLKDVFGDEGSEQCVFVLKIIADNDFANHCNEATQAFGKELTRRFGGEESFFDTVNSAEFIDARTYDPMVKKTKKVDFHSVAVIKTSNDSKAETSCVIFDLTYYTVSGSDGILVINSPGDLNNAMKTLRGYYGGSWKPEFNLNKETGKFLYND